MFISKNKYEYNKYDSEMCPVCNQLSCITLFYNLKNIIYYYIIIVSELSYYSEIIIYMFYLGKHINNYVYI